MNHLVRRGIVKRRANDFVIAFKVIKPPVFTRMRPLTSSGCRIASRAAAYPPTELPMKIAGGRLSDVTMSSRTSPNRSAVGPPSDEGWEESPCQGQSIAIV
jgi:hypothetical protein